MTKRFWLLLLSSLLVVTLPGCRPAPAPTLPALEPDDASQVLSPVYLLPQLNFELEELIGEKIWAMGYYADASFSKDGVGFLVLNPASLMVDERLPEHSLARLDGELPPVPAGYFGPGSDPFDGILILVYGEVKDYGDTYVVYTIQPTPLITVEESHILSMPAKSQGWGESFLGNILGAIPSEGIFPTGEALAQGAAGTRASACDRALIISGGVDANNNHPRYRNNVIAKYRKLRALGFNDNQIAVLYDDGGAINVDGANITDDKATKQKIRDTINRFLNEMPASCTLTIFVTDHGTGYNDAQGYNGARPAFSGETGKRYSESTFKIDLKHKVYRTNVWKNAAGDTWLVYMNKKTNRLELYKWEGGKWVSKGKDTNGDGRITEAETGQDVDGDGDKDEVGWNEAALGAWQHQNNDWDTDGDGNNDVRARWDGTRYVVERFKDGKWQKMGEDKNGDFIIDGDDGGVDWNLDGDTDYYDLIGFHEGINLWGNEVLWDDEFADMLKPLQKKGIHVVIEMAQCFAGGFIENLKGIVEKIVTFSGEDTKHWNRRDAAGTVYAADEIAFVDNLGGIDLESWDEAFDRAREADRAKWRESGGNPETENKHQKWEKPVIEGGTFFEKGGVYTLAFVIPESLRDKVYDFEILFGLQKPRWADGETLKMPDGFTSQKIAGGIKIESTKPFPTGTPLEFKFKGAENAQSMRIHLTDKDHKNLGYMIPKKGAPPPEKPVYTRSPAVRDCAEWLGQNTGLDDCLGGNFPDAAPGDYIEFMRYRLEGFLADPDPSIPEAKRDCAQDLVEFLDGASEGDRDWVANIFADSYFAAQEACRAELAEAEVLQASLEASARSVRDESGCHSTLTISFAGQDLTEGSYPVTSVVLRVNGAVWHDSGVISATHYQNSASREVGCGETFTIEVTATNNIGLTTTATKSITTPVP